MSRGIHDGPRNKTVRYRSVFKQPFADPATGGLFQPAGTGTTVSPYTQVANMTLGQLNPTVVANPLLADPPRAMPMPQGGLGSLAPVTSRTS